jgi:hypothetical protein
MTTTRQDLEDAAKAAGMQFDSFQECWFQAGEMAGPTWNPLINKADLWDLAEKCGMCVDHMHGVVLWWDGLSEYVQLFPPHNHTECAEAVILAATEIWRAKK